MPESIDFRRPQVNRTALDDGACRDLYRRIADRVTAYNQEMMMGGQGSARLNWIA